MTKAKTDSPPKLDLKDLSHRQEVLSEGLQNFLDDNELHLSDQNFDRAFQHLLSATMSYKDITLYDVQNYLKQILEYHEYVIDTMNKTGLAEDSLIKLIITAENDQRNQLKNNGEAKPERKPWKFSLSALPLPVVTSLLILVGFAVATPFMPHSPESTLFQTTDIHNEIGISSINELREMVKELSTLEQAHGNEVSPATIWNDVKALDNVTRHGYKSSYKNFSPAQYNAAKAFLETRIQALKETQVK